MKGTDTGTSFNRKKLDDWRKQRQSQELQYQVHNIPWFRIQFERIHLQNHIILILLPNIPIRTL